MASFKKTIASSVGFFFNALVILGHTLLFIGAISVLWGWYYIGLVNCIILLVMAFDNDGYIKRMRSHWKGFRGLGQGERIALLYCLMLMIVAVAVNLVFIVTYMMGIYRPPF